MLRERSCARGEKRGGKKRGSADLLAKEQRAASETQRDFATLKKSDTTTKAANGADEKYNASDFAAYDAGKNLAPPIFRRKAGAENSAQTSKADTSRRKIWPFSIKLGAGSICILADASRVLRPL
nr:hypothetical protein [uncultured Campylobacter sp.]